MVAGALVPATQEAEAGRLLEAQKFGVSLGNTARLTLKN
jgi:hypothetical protein